MTATVNQRSFNITLLFSPSLPLSRLSPLRDTNLSDYNNEVLTDVPLCIWDMIGKTQSLQDNPWDSCHWIDAVRRWQGWNKALPRAMYFTCRRWPSCWGKPWWAGKPLCRGKGPGLAPCCLGVLTWLQQELEVGGRMRRGRHKGKSPGRLVSWYHFIPSVSPREW